MSSESLSIDYKHNDSSYIIQEEDARNNQGDDWDNGHD